MSNAAKVLILAIGIAAAAACHKAQPPMNATANDDLSLDDNASAAPSANADVEALPADESSATSNGELNKGEDNPDVNDDGNED